MISKETINNLIAYEISKSIPKSRKKFLYPKLYSQFVYNNLFEFYKTRTSNMTTRGSTGVKKFMVLYSTLLFLFLLVALLALKTRSLLILPPLVILVFALFKLTTLYNLRRCLGYNLSKKPNVIIPNGSLNFLCLISIYKKGGKIIIGPYKVPKDARQVKLYLAKGDGVYVALADYYKKGNLSLTDNIPYLLNYVTGPIKYQRK